MEPSDNLAAKILAAIAALPLEQQAEAIHALIGSSMQMMPLERVMEMRAEIAAQFDNKIPVVASTLDLIDGHLALRQINPNWATTTLRRSKYSARYFAFHDDAVRNGSFVVIRVRGKKSYVATYMNGDHMCNDHIGVDAIDAVAAALIADGRLEYTEAKFKALAPKGCGGKQ